MCKSVLDANKECFLGCLEVILDREIMKIGKLNEAESFEYIFDRAIKFRAFSDERDCRDCGTCWGVTEGSVAVLFFFNLN